MTNKLTDRKTYTEEFKRDAVRLSRERGNFATVARDLGLYPSILRKWVIVLKGESNHPFPGKGNPQDPQLAELLKENARLKEGNEILKKAVGVFHIGCDVRG
jgi:transposase